MIRDTKPHARNILGSISMGLKSNILDVSEYSVNFNVARFFKIFIYHLLFFVFGPLVVPVVIIFDSLKMANNMSFWFGGSHRNSLVIQYSQWLANVYFIVAWFLHFLYKDKDDNTSWVKGIYFE